TQPWAMFEYFAVVISPTEAKTRGPQPDLLTTSAVWTTQSDFGLCWPSITLDGSLDDMDSKKLEAGKPTKTVERIAGPPRCLAIRELPVGQPSLTFVLSRLWTITAK